MFGIWNKLIKGGISFSKLRLFTYSFPKLKSILKVFTYRDWYFDRFIITDWKIKRAVSSIS